MDSAKKIGYDPLLVIGLFMVVFGILVLISIFFAPSDEGKLVNLICGIVIIIISAIFITYSFRRGRKFLR